MLLEVWLFLNLAQSLLVCSGLVVFCCNWIAIHLKKDEYIFFVHQDSYILLLPQWRSHNSTQLFCLSLSHSALKPKQITTIPIPSTRHLSRCLQRFHPPKIHMQSSSVPPSLNQQTPQKTGMSCGEGTTSCMYSLPLQS